MFQIHWVSIALILLTLGNRKLKVYFSFVIFRLLIGHCLLHGWSSRLCMILKKGFRKLYFADDICALKETFRKVKPVNSAWKVVAFLVSYGLAYIPICTLIIKLRTNHRRSPPLMLSLFLLGGLHAVFAHFNGLLDSSGSTIRSASWGHELCLNLWQAHEMASHLFVLELGHKLHFLLREFLVACPTVIVRPN